MSAPNTLSEEFEKELYNRRKTALSRLNTSLLLAFPKLTEDDLKVLLSGTYQLSLAVSYLAEVLKEDGTIDASFLKVTPTIKKFEIRSRHINSKTYNVYIHFEPNCNEIGGIKRYCCSCPNGKRTVGCCSHVASVTYYLSHARYLSRIFRPAAILSKVFERTEANPVINENSDDDDLIK